VSQVAAIGLVKRYRGRHGVVTALDGVDIELLPGRIVGVVGPSLCGKTTLVSVLAGWERVDAGQVRWAGGARPEWSELAVIPQGFALVDEATVAENVLLSARCGGPPITPERLAEVGASIGIDHLLDRLVTEISVGERQRTMAARALVGRPACLLADEPVAHQDERNGANILAMLRAAADDGAACLVASRSPEVLEAIADEIVELDRPR